MTSFTDLLICIISLVFYYIINRFHKKESFERKWSHFYLWMFISTFIGTFAHGARFYMTDNLFNILWMIMNIAGLISTYYSIYATISYANYSNNLEVKTINALTSVVLGFVGLTLFFNTFLLVKIFAGMGLIYIFYTHLRYYQIGIIGNGNIIFGIGVSFLTVFVHTFKISLHKHFNYKDISHLIMIISLCFIFTGINTINKDRINRKILL